jgi:hypothetical protein
MGRAYQSGKHRPHRTLSSPCPLVNVPLVKFKLSRAALHWALLLSKAAAEALGRFVHASRGLLHRCRFPCKSMEQCG